MLRLEFWKLVKSCAPEVSKFWAKTVTVPLGKIRRIRPPMLDPPVVLFVPAGMSGMTLPTPIGMTPTTPGPWIGIWTGVAGIAGVVPEAGTAIEFTVTERPVARSVTKRLPAATGAAMVEVVIPPVVEVVVVTG